MYNKRPKRKTLTGRKRYCVEMCENIEQGITTDHNIEKNIFLFRKEKHWKEKKWVLSKKKKSVSGRKSFWVTRIGNV